MKDKTKQNKTKNATAKRKQNKKKKKEKKKIGRKLNTFKSASFFLPLAILVS